MNLSKSGLLINICSISQNLILMKFVIYTRIKLLHIISTEGSLHDQPLSLLYKK